MHVSQKYPYPDSITIVQATRRPATQLSRGKLLALPVLIMLAFVLTACGGSTSRKPDEVTKPRKDARPAKGKGAKLDIIKSLNAQYASWKGVRYRMGGLSKKGVDCSGFVFLTFKDQFKMNIPRSTILLSKYGQQIKKSSLRAGDLVFFNTRPNVRHVGIYYKDNKFMHASTSKGVMISDLNNVYWKKHYWQSRRPKM